MCQLVFSLNNFMMLFIWHSYKYVTKMFIDCVLSLYAISSKFVFAVCVVSLDSSHMTYHMFYQCILYGQTVTSRSVYAQIFSFCYVSLTVLFTINLLYK